MIPLILLSIFLVIFIYFIYINIYFHNMSFQIFLKKIVKKIYKMLFKKNLFDGPVGIKSLYSIEGNNKNNLLKTNNALILNISTSDKSNQAVHPDVIYIDEGFGFSKKNKYWMVCTPYPNQDDRFENPEIFCSEDGFFWDPPKNNINPIVKRPKYFLSHNSDASIILNKDKLIVFFRTSFYEKKNNMNKIQTIESTDGVNWQNIKLLFESKNNLYLSPAVKKLKNEWIMWMVDYQNDDKNILSIYRRTSKNLTDWENNSKVICKNLPQGNIPWHIGVEIVDDKIFCFLTSIEKIGSKKLKNWLARSDDGGHSFNIIKQFENDRKFENWFQYRGSMVYSQIKEKIEIFYSAVDKNNICYIARKDKKKSDFYE